MRPSERPTASTSAAGEGSRNVTAAPSSRKRAMRAPVRTFHSSRAPDVLPITTLLRYVGGCASAEGSNEAPRLIARTSDSLSQFHTHRKPSAEADSR